MARARSVPGRLSGAGGACQRGEYLVYSCRTPAGAAAPTDGWSGSISGPWMYDVDGCASGGSLTAAFGGKVAQPANVSIASWGFSTPAGTRIAAARLWRTGEAVSWVTGASTLTWGAAPENSYASADVFEQCPAYAGCTSFGDPGAPMSQANLIGVPPTNLDGATHFKFPGPATYRFRVLCPREADFPFLVGVSNIVSVRER